MESVALPSTNHPQAVSPLGEFAFDAATKPAPVFTRPSEVLTSNELTLDQKRAVLASWASDAWAVESMPALRLCPVGGRPEQVDEVLAALQALDAEGHGHEPMSARPRRGQVPLVHRARPTYAREGKGALN